MADSYLLAAKLSNLPKNDVNGKSTANQPFWTYIGGYLPLRKTPR
jgi:hypothetical protein